MMQLTRILTYGCTIVRMTLPGMIAIGLLISQLSWGQQFGGNPPSTKWKQISNDTVRVIFPESLQATAKQVATISLDLSAATARSIGDRIRKIDIVLQNQTTISNGYVALGPYRSEFQTTPDPNNFSLGSLPWVQTLAIHEYRHAQQYNNFRRGFASFFYVLFGEEGQALANALTVPDWFFEGDAVYQETLVTSQGRGRMPSFFNGYRSLWAAGKKYSYMKLRNGSLRDFVPNHYPLGYMFVAYGREKYGEEFWKKVTADAAGWRSFFYPMQNAIARHSGKSFHSFVDSSFSFFNVNRESKTEPKHFVADQEYPHWIDSNSIIYLKTTYDRVPAFVIRQSDGKERMIRVRDIPVDNYFSYRNGKIVYAGYRADLRWGWRDFNDLKIVDITDGSQRSLTHKTKYFSPDISEDGSRVVAVHVAEDGRSELHIISTSNGSVEMKVENSSGLFYTYPKFYGIDRVVTTVRDQSGKMSIAIVSISGDDVRYLLPFSWNIIGFPSVAAESFYFTASYKGADRIFRWKNDQLYLLAQTDIGSEGRGNYQVNVLNDRLVWSRFTSTGYRLMFETKNEEALIPASTFASGGTDFGIKSLEDSLNGFLANLRTSNFSVTRYSRSFQLFNFHSRRPYISDPDYSFSFVSENILNTLQAELSINYNRNERYKQFGFSAIYGQLFPMFRVGTQYTVDRNARIRTSGPRTYWNEWETTAGFSIPLNFTTGKTFTRLTVGSDFVYNKRYFTGFYKDTFQNRGFGYLNTFVTFTNRIQQARQHIYPRFAQSVTLNYKNAVANLDGNQFVASGTLYLPGMLLNHNLLLQAAWHRRDTLSNIRFANSFPFSRGYSTNNFHQMWKLGANYHFPLVYPDWGFGQILYFLRIRANIFYDYTRVADYNNARQLLNAEFRSYGTEIYFDTRWWNQLPVSFGFRYSRLLDRDIDGRTSNQFEFVLPVNLLNRE